MHDTEIRALRRAAILLVAISALRWAWLARERPTPAGGASVLPELVEASRAEAAEEERRATPLAEGERIDPNRAGEVELDRLPGVGATTARAIVAAREAGAVFREPDDLLTVRGIGPATLERFRDALDLRNPPPARAGALGRGSEAVSGGGRGGRAVDGGERASPPRPLDLNRADAEALERLPGIGPALADRILAARRERLFTSLEDLERVPGIGPATIERLRTHARVGGGP
ncbi:MAG TPA: helix-hairpin-helix domain-containing protein [Longimicrobiales bacterium]|nr:helix-hairpin-helix domain-containing protein [Longimicrobiales bacterium]